MKLQARNFVVRKPETIDITMFFKKFCIATRTKRNESRLGSFLFHFLFFMLQNSGYLRSLTCSRALSRSRASSKALRKRSSWPPSDQRTVPCQLAFCRKRMRT